MGPFGVEMEFRFRVLSGYHGVFDTCEIAQGVTSPGSVDVRPPPFDACEVVDAGRARLVVDSSLGVLAILHVGGGTQVRPTIVGAHAVNVIDLVFGPLSCLVQPR
jgi:hypothetical protein